MIRAIFVRALMMVLATAWLMTAAAAFAQNGQQPAATVKDPVCGMKLDPAKAAAKVAYQGKTYYLCSDECKAKFEKEPAKYAEKQQAPKQ